MAIIGQTQGFTIPAVGLAGTAYASQINTVLEAIETVLETMVTPSSIDINADLSAAGNSITSVNTVAYSAVSGTPAVRSTYVSSGEFYFKDGSGNAVQITSGGSLNASALGGIGGDYGTTNAQVRYSDASTMYVFQSDTVAATGSKVVVGSLGVAGVGAGDVDYPMTLEHTTITRAVGGSSYDIALANAAPAGRRLMQIDGSGVVTYQNAVTSGLTVSDTGLTVTAGGLTVTAGGLTVSASGATITGNSSVTGTLTSSGALTVSSGGAAITGTCAVTGAVTASTNITATQQLYYNGDRYHFMPVALANKVGSPALVLSASTGEGPYATLGTSEGAATCFGIAITDTETIDDEIKVFVRTNTAATVSVRATWVDINGGTFSLSAGTTATAAVGGSTDYVTAFDIGADMSCTTGGSVWSGNLPVFYTIKVWSNQADTFIYGMGYNLKAG